MNCPVCKELMEHSMVSENWGCEDCGVIVLKEDAIANNGKFYRVDEMFRANGDH